MGQTIKKLPILCAGSMNTILTRTSKKYDTCHNYIQYIELNLKRTNKVHLAYFLGVWRSKDAVLCTFQLSSRCRNLVQSRTAPLQQMPPVNLSMGNYTKLPYTQSFIQHSTVHAIIYTALSVDKKQTGGQECFSMWERQCHLALPSVMRG